MSKIAFMTIIIALVAAILSPSVVVNTFAASSGDGNGGDGGGDVHEPKVAHDKYGRPVCGGCYIGKKGCRQLC